MVFCLGEEFKYLVEEMHMLSPFVCAENFLVVDDNGLSPSFIGFQTLDLLL